MKKLIPLTLTVIFILALSSCADSLPMSQLPGIQLSGGNLLPSYEVLICRSGDKKDTDGIGSELSPEEIIAQYKDKIPMTEISDEQITLIAGAEYIRSGVSVKSIDYEINFVGVYTTDGLKSEYTEKQLSDLPNGEYIICAGTVRHDEDETEEKYLFSGVKKESTSKTEDSLWDSLDFKITQNVENFDFSEFDEISGWFGAREYLGRGYRKILGEGGVDSKPTHYVSYLVTAYPDYADGGAYVTEIRITDPEVTLHGLSVNSSFAEFDEVFTKMGFELYDGDGAIPTRIAEKDGIKYRLTKYENPELVINAEVTNREGINY